MINNLDISDFLKNYWQKKPLIIRSAFPCYQSPVSADELAGLACEEFIESRIISENNTETKWQLEKGPFNESRFTTLPETNWTLLIQGLNKIFPEFDDLLHQFNFIPSWRVDDLMASYAAPGGSVGPHLDQYDVFLLQAQGTRKWMISEQAIEKDNFIENIPLKIIKDFTAESEWILEAGDMLYLPANVAHYGIGIENCMTFSVGFRAPSYADLISSFIDDQVTDIPDTMRYHDPELSADANPGEITPAAINNVQEILLSQLKDKSKVEDWFGRFITDYLNDNAYLEENSLSTNEFLSEFKINGYLRRPATVRANYLSNKNHTIHLYINGAQFKYRKNTEQVVKLFCNQHVIGFTNTEALVQEPNNLALLCELYNRGYLEFSDEQNKN
ncbi:MAG: cupin domain-containing protein [Gammaproteobacteria bacterium]|nr:cupin domain-containing protein [Gammaproteobacteria bacterium]